MPTSTSPLYLTGVYATKFCTQIATKHARLGVWQTGHQVGTWIAQHHHCVTVQTICLCWWPEVACAAQVGWAKGSPVLLWPAPPLLPLPIGPSP